MDSKESLPWANLWRPYPLHLKKEGSLSSKTLLCEDFFIRKLMSINTNPRRKTINNNVKDYEDSYLWQTLRIEMYNFFLRCIQKLINFNSDNTELRSILGQDLCYFTCAFPLNNPFTMNIPSSQTETENDRRKGDIVSVYEHNSNYLNEMGFLAQELWDALLDGILGENYSSPGRFKVYRKFISCYKKLGEILLRIGELDKWKAQKLMEVLDILFDTFHSNHIRLNIIRKNNGLPPIETIGKIHKYDESQYISCYLFNLKECYERESELDTIFRELRIIESRLVVI
jgi:hypothetical protein